MMEIITTLFPVEGGWGKPRYSYLGKQKVKGLGKQKSKTS